MAALSFRSTSTITTRRAGRTVSGVIAIRAYLGGEDPGREGSCQLQCCFKAAAGTLSHDSSVRRRGFEESLLQIVCCRDFQGEHGAGRTDWSFEAEDSGSQSAHLANA